MKQIIILIFGCMALISCEPVSDSETNLKADTSQGLCVKCKLRGSNQSSESNDDVITRAVESVAGNVKKITIALLDAQKNVVNVVRQNENETDFGKINVNCEPGTYTLLCVGSNSDVDVAVANGGIISFDGNKIKDCFCHCQDVTVYKNKRKSVTSTMNRCVTRLRLESNETIPSDVAFMNVSLGGVSTKYDVVNGCGIDTGTLEKKDIDLSALAGAKLDINIYAFLPQADNKVNADIEFMDANKANLYSLTLSNFQMQPNTESFFNGDMFINGGADGDITLNTDWNTPISITQ